MMRVISFISSCHLVLIKVILAFVSKPSCLREPHAVFIVYELDNAFDSNDYKYTLQESNKNQNDPFSKPSFPTLCQTRHSLIVCPLEYILKKTYLFELVAENRTDVITSDVSFYKVDGPCVCSGVNLNTQITTWHKNGLSVTWKYSDGLFPTTRKLYLTNTKTNRSLPVNEKQCLPHDCPLNHLEICQTYLFCVETVYEECKNGSNLSCKKVALDVDQNLKNPKIDYCNYKKNFLSSAWRNVVLTKQSYIEYRIFKNNKLILSRNSSNSMINTTISDIALEDKIEISIRKCFDCKCSGSHNQSCIAVVDLNNKVLQNKYVTNILITLASVGCFILIIIIIMCLWRNHQASHGTKKFNDVDIKPRNEIITDSIIYKEIADLELYDHVIMPEYTLAVKPLEFNLKN